MEVSQIENAIKGQIFDFHYTVSGWGKQGQIETLINKLDTDVRWKIINYTWNDPKLIIRIEIVVNPLPIIIIVAAIGAIGTGLFCYLSLDKIEKVVSSPIGGAATLGVVLLGGLLVYRFAT